MRLFLGYFDRLAEHSFRTNSDGERLFFRDGPWTRPFVIPDEATEQRLRKRLKRLYMATFFLAVLPHPFLFEAFPQITDEPLWFFGYFTVFVVGWLLVTRAVLAPEVAGLHRSATRLPLRNFFGQMADRHSKASLVFWFAACLVVTAAGVWLLSLGESVVFGLLVIAFGCLAAVAWGYTLLLRFTK